MLALANYVMKRIKFNCVLPSGHLSLSLVSFFYHQLLHFLTSSKDCLGLEIVFFPSFFVLEYLVYAPYFLVINSRT